MINNNNRVKGVTRADRTEGGEVGKKGEEGEEKILAHGQVDQSKVVQEVLADLKLRSICVGEAIVNKRLKLHALDIHSRIYFFRYRFIWYSSLVTYFATSISLAFVLISARLEPGLRLSKMLLLQFF